MFVTSLYENDHFIIDDKGDYFCTIVILKIIMIFIVQVVSMKSLAIISSFCIYLYEGSY